METETKLETENVLLNAITLQFVMDAAEYMNEDEEVTFTNEELEKLSEELRDGVMDVISQFLNSR